MENLCSFKTTLLTRTQWPDARIREELSTSMGRGRISFSYNGREILFVEEKGKASPGKLFFRGAPWDQKEYQDFLEYMIVVMKKIFGRTFGEDKIKEAVYTGKLKTKWGEADVVLLGKNMG